MVLNVLVILLVDFTRETVGGLVILLMLQMMALQVPIAIAMIVAASFGLFVLGNVKIVVDTVQSLMFDAVASWQMSIIPLFVLMGIAMWKGGLTTKAYAAANQWMAKLPGGLAVGTNFAGAGLAAASGSTVGISYALGRMAIPEMLRAGYSPALATGAVASAGTLGQIIPPSLLLVIFAGIAQVPVGPQLLAGIIPGILIALGYGILIVIWAMVRPQDAPKLSMDGITWATRFRSLLGILPIAIVVIIVLGGIYTGIFTSTEAAAIGAIAALLVSWLTFGKGNRGFKRTWGFLKSSFTETATSVAGIFLLLIGVYALTRVMTISGIAQWLSATILDMDLSRIEILLILILVYVALGTFLDPLAMILLTLPFLQAPLAAMGVDMIWFGIFVVVLGEIAILSPPVGMLTFVVHRLAQNPQVNGGVKVSLPTVFLGVTPFIGVSLLMVLLFIFFPQIVTWLPDISRAG
ncbi:TRAP transporter large permease [Microbacterium sp. A93]|uniref:TRAP transporter large permease n=1 Tax=Microbacterium sp. A93 TaxID=3450716 RepID=UPI003F434B11